MAKVAQREAELQALREENAELRAEIKRLKTRINNLLKKSDDK
jgi:cell division protein FtsB